MQPASLIADRYELKEKLGVGGMGAVFKARDLETGDSVALKRLHAFILAEDEGFMERFQQEGRFLQQLNHPHILRIRDADSQQGLHYIVTDYVPGGSLADLLTNQRRLSLTRSLSIATQLADALTAAHEANIIHCDLKPANVLLAEDGNVRLTDFGASLTAYSSRTETDFGSVGTAAYMSPEQCIGEPLDARTDIWSLGIILFEMLAGRRPFDEISVADQMMAILADPTPDIQALRPQVGHRLADLIYRMLAKNRYQRIPDARLVQAELTAIYRIASDPETPSTQEVEDELEGPRYYLPYVATPFVGRQREMLFIQQRLRDPQVRLITLYGLSGIGKTRLALQTATNNLDRFKHGVYFIDLSAVTAVDQLAPVIAEAVQFNFYAPDDLEEQLLNYLQNKEMLLLLDNLETFDGRADFMARLAERARWIQMLVTTLEKLNVEAEHALRLGGLDMPEVITPATITSASVQLFLQGARRVRLDYDPDEQDMDAIVQISRAVNGMPLGIELAASWMHMMSPRQIAAQIQNDMDFLVAKSLDDDVPIRHHSLRSVLEHSWRLLDKKERTAMRRLAVFHSSFSREAAHQIIGASPRTLNALIEKSLLRRSPVNGRYQVQVIMSRFVGKKLDNYSADKAETQARFADYYLSLIGETLPQLQGGPYQMKRLRELDRDFGNIRAAWLWATDQNQEELLDKAADGMYAYYLLRGRQREGAEMFGQAARTLRLADESDQRLVARLLGRRGACARFIGRLDEARFHLEDSLELARALDNRRETAFSLVQLGAVTPDTKEAVALWEEGLALAEALADEILIAEALNWLAFGRYQTGDLEAAVSLLRRALNIRRRLVDRHGLAVSLANLGVVHIHMGENDVAQRLLEEALAMQKALKNRHGMANIATNLSHIALNTGAYEQAQRRGEEAVTLYRDLGDRRGEGLALGNLSEVAFAQGRYDQSATICRECIALYRKLKLPTAPYLNILGRIALAQGKFDDAATAFQQALAEKPDLSLTLNIFTGMAAIMAHDGYQETAVGLLCFIQDHPASESAVRERVAALLQTLTTGRSAAAAEEQPLSYWQKTIAAWLSDRLY